MSQSSSPRASGRLVARLTTGRTGRRLAGAGTAVGLAVAAALTAPVVASAAPGAPAGPGAIGPGSQISTPQQGGAELCTANFVFSGNGKTYLGAAAHCMAGENSSQGVDGCKEPVMPEGVRVDIAGRDGKTYTGTVAYNSWKVMQDKGEKARDLCTFNDLSLIELSPEAEKAVDPTVPNFGGPTALDTDGTKDGEKVYSYQPNQTAPTPNKQGVSLGQPDGPRTHVVQTTPPGIPGDSGSGFLDADGKAFGVLSSLMAPTSSNGVTDLSKALDYAAANGKIGKVSLVPGNKPFTPGNAKLTKLPSGSELPQTPLPELQPLPLG
ncbi:trypsin-like peptidase domain-containing protein [Pseudonocardia phyllosphaerae]|uniref:trypsin-like peptidase domain-containing protein n=1 Tax=Pseudonocardia phyllosphaerae TaxID=3390502 RepID=UPI00397C24C0